MGTISAIILAGGLGTRLRSVVSDVPKPMASINGRPFLEYLLDYWITQGVGHFILSVGYLQQVIIEHFRYVYHGAILEYVAEERPLGTGGGVLLAAKALPDDEYFLLLNGDTYFATDLQQLICYTQQHNADCCFSLFRSNQEGRYMSLELRHDNCIVGLKPGQGRSGSLVNGGVYCLRRNALMEEQFTPDHTISLEGDIFPAALAANRRLLGIEVLGVFIDIGVPEDYLRASQVLGVS